MKVKLNYNGIEFMAEISDEDIRKLTKSKEDFEKRIKRAESLYHNILRRSIELCDKLDWKDHTQEKWRIWYDCYTGGIISTATYSGRDLGQIYFDTEEHADQVIEEFKDELIWYFTEFKERMD